jgi:DNA repair photolyase
MLSMAGGKMVPTLKIAEVQAKSILNKSKIFDYCVNPYTGCQVGCRYCYARLFIPRYSGHSEPWGEFADVKVNAPQILRKQLMRARRGIVWVASVCDPYQPLEAKYKLTRRCLEELAAAQFPVHIQSKSVLALRDLDVFLEFKEIEFTFTIATDDEKIARTFEPRASSIKERIGALEKLHQAGIKTQAFIGPLLPGNPERLVAQLEGKVDDVLIDRMNYMDMIRSFYVRLGMVDASTDAFFQKQKEKLVTELRKRNMTFEELF